MSQQDGGGATKSPGATIDEVYRDRNLLAQFAAALAQRCGFPVGTGIDADEPDWPVVYIDLPTGQVSWHIPKGELVAGLGPYEREWDGHDGPKKERRIRAFLEQTVG